MYHIHIHAYITCMVLYIHVQYTAQPQKITLLWRSAHMETHAHAGMHGCIYIYYLCRVSTLLMLILIVILAACLEDHNHDCRGSSITNSPLGEPNSSQEQKPTFLSRLQIYLRHRMRMYVSSSSEALSWGVTRGDQARGTPLDPPRTVRLAVSLTAEQNNAGQP